MQSKGLAASSIMLSSVRDDLTEHTPRTFVKLPHTDHDHLVASPLTFDQVRLIAKTAHLCFMR